MAQSQMGGEGNVYAGWWWERDGESTNRTMAIGSFVVRVYYIEYCIKADLTTGQGQGMQMGTGLGNVTWTGLLRRQDGC